MLRKSLVSILLLTAYLGSCLLIYNTETNTKSIKTTNIENSTNTANYINNKNIQTDNEIIGTLTIEKLNLSKSIYNINSSHNNVEENDEIIGTLTIDKLNLSKNIYNINSSHNNVEENVTILNDDINLIVLAAHSGPGYIAFFNDLDKLELNDTINLTYKGKDLVYKVTNIEEQAKDGTIEINKTNKQRLILTTCSKKDKNKQLVITTEKIDA